MRHQKESLDKLCIWKEMIEEGRDPHKRLSPLCREYCDGYNEKCLAYKPAEETRK